MIWAKFFNENFPHDYFFLSNVRTGINPALTTMGMAEQLHRVLKM